MDVYSVTLTIAPSNQKANSPNFQIGASLSLLFIGKEPVKLCDISSLKLTWHLEMDGWNTSFLLGRPIFMGYVSFREGKWVVSRKPKHPIGCLAIFIARYIGAWYDHWQLYQLGLPPTQDSSHHQDCHIFSRESQAKPSFATGILGGG